MSDWNADLDAIGVLVADALAALAPTLVVERGWRNYSNLGKGELPRLFLFDPRSTERALQFAQAEVTSTYKGELWADTTQVVLGTWRLAIVAAVAADPTLRGAAKRFRLVTSAVLETYPGAKDDRRVLTLDFSSLVVE